MNKKIEIDNPENASLRDWFAGMALCGELTTHNESQVWKNFNDLALGCYKIADAMLKEREKYDKQKTKTCTNSQA